MHAWLKGQGRRRLVWKAAGGLVGIGGACMHRKAASGWVELGCWCMRRFQRGINMQWKFLKAMWRMHVLWVK